MWIKLKGIDSTGELQIAGTRGSLARAMQDGIVDWPEDVPVPAGSQAAAPPAEVKARELARKRAEARALAESLGLQVVDDTSGDVAPADHAGLPGTVGVPIFGTPPPLTEPAKPAPRKRTTKA